MIGRAFLRLCVVPGVLVGALAAVVLAGDAKSVLGDEDVVRMIAAGTAEDEIVRTIEEREVQFDLSEDMLAELRIAGVSERIIGVMRARQARNEPPPAPRSPIPAPAENLASVRVSFVPARASEAAIWVPTTAGDAMAKALGLGRSPENRRIEGIALFVACTTPDHVPDQWRIRSPLGRDFVSMPRHELLALQAGAIRARFKDVPRGVRGGSRDLDHATESDWLRLDLPVELSASLLPGVAHDLVVGVALLVGETYLVLDLDERRGFVTTPDAAALRASVGRHDTHSDALEVRFVVPPP